MVVVVVVTLFLVLVLLLSAGGLFGNTHLLMKLQKNEG